MSRYYAHKSGRVYNLFTTPFTDWNATPEGEFPTTYPGIESDEHLFQALGTRDVVIIDRPKPKEENLVSKLPIGALLAGLASLGVSPERVSQVEGTLSPQSKQEGALASKLEPTVLAEAARVREASEIQDRMLQEFRVVLAESRVDAEIVANFILAICPDLEQNILDLASAPKRKRVTL